MPALPRSPLRYPGGKATITPLISDLLDPSEVELVEPFAGSASLSIALLTAGLVDHAHIADADPGIAAFWNVLTTDCQSLIVWFASVTPTLEAFQHWQSVDTNDPRTLAQRTLFLSRTAWGGIPTAGPIGGWTQSDGRRITDRWNRTETLARLGNVAELAAAGRLTAAEYPADWRETLAAHPNELAFIDPPYRRDGDRLYRHRFTAHQQLAQTLHDRPGRSLITYGDDEFIRSLYSTATVIPVDRRYSSLTSSEGRTEILIDTRPGGNRQ